MMGWCSHLSESFPEFVMIQSKALVNETEIDVLLKFPRFFYNPAIVGNLIFSFSSISKPNLDIWKFLVRIMLKPSMQDFKHDLTSVGDECNCLMLSTFFGTTLLGNWDDKDRPFSSLVATAGSSRYAEITNAKP